MAASHHAASIWSYATTIKRWKELTRFVGNGDEPISRNWMENPIRPVALGRSNWLFAGGLRAGKRAS